MDGQVAERRGGIPWWSAWLAGLAGLYAAVLIGGLLVAETALQRLDTRVFHWINDLGPANDVVWAVLNPHTRNYALMCVVVVAGAAVRGPRNAVRALALLLAAAFLAWGLVEATYAVWDRPRPEELLGPGAVVLGDNAWADHEAYPSGHAAVTGALAAAGAMAVPFLRWPLWAWTIAVGVSRVFFGAHFPSDVVAGLVVGWGSARLVALLFSRYEEAGGRLARRVLTHRRPARAGP